MSADKGHIPEERKSLGHSGPTCIYTQIHTEYSNRMELSLATETANLIFVILAINSKSSCSLLYQFYYISKCLTNTTTLRDDDVIILK